MEYSRKLTPPIVSATVLTIVLTASTIVGLAQRADLTGVKAFSAIWPIVLSSTVATILVMSLLYRAIFHLLHELEVSEAAARDEARRDQLTGLANRSLLMERIDDAIRRCKTNDEQSALLFIDLDRFKAVNDTLGHAFGDLLIKEVAKHLLDRSSIGDTVARLGGDEFAILATNLDGRQAVEELCSNLVNTISQPIVIKGKEARVSASVGVVFISASSSRAALIRRADITMYHAKSIGRNCYHIFCSRIDNAVRRKALVEMRLRKALETGDGLRLDFQPQLSVDRKIIGAEGLLRWTDDKLGSVNPDEIIPIAEEAGLIDAVGELVIRQACLAAQLIPDITIAANLSPLQFANPRLATQLAELVAEYGLPCKRIELEITEHHTMLNAMQYNEIMEELRAAGFTMALDDFGTGYSSLSYLRELSVDKLKIDRSFIEAATQGRGADIIHAVVSLGHALNLQVVAEGIATLFHEKIALESGCDILQGHLYSRAVSLSDLARMVVQNPSTYMCGTVNGGTNVSTGLGAI
ncbi:putative bifunctional diguanylate cyclase/phosphodiesterase [Aquisediminimonas sediminicola]|uniref:putative bifunctional diguanylate cyclase/phosphodiesterase n=1 Tax=Alteraquisediminimonas sediminicola TaxID=2676787 RepID=UPI001C8EB9F7|nr:GGDEF domain-containing phosphodiesterase [Aquisediminimonas sediminicola]